MPHKAESRLAQLRDRQRAYWRKNLWLTAILLLAWFGVTFGSSWYAAELNQITLIGPLGYYMGAQGVMLVYILIIGIYSRRMNALDREYDASEGED